MKRVLIVSPHFPPINAPDMQRVRMSLPYYRVAGWEPVVLCVAPEYVDGFQEPELLATIPPNVRIVACRALSLRIGRRIGVGNVGLRGFLSLLRAGSELLRREHFDLVFFSNTQFNTFLLGPIWRARHGVPYALDFQDPWRTDYYERAGSRRPPGGWKYRFARLHPLLFEGPVVRRAAGVMSVSENYLADITARYPGFAAPSDVILFGASREDLTHAKRLPPPASAFARNPGELHILYTGASGPVTPHALSVLFDAFRLYSERAPERAKRIRFHFFGTSYVAPGRGRPTVMPLAQERGVADNVDEIPHRLGHLECLRLQSDADVLLLPGSSDLAYSPSKAYPYYLSGNPILGLVFRDSVMERLLEDLRCAYLVRFREHEAKDAAHAELHRVFDLALEGFPSGMFPERDDTRFDRHYLAEELTRRQCALFERALAFERTRKE